MSPQLFLSVLCMGLATAIVSVTMIVIMPKERILNWWFRFGEYCGKQIIDNIECERWFYKPIWGCEKCFAGQLALWIYFFSHITGNSPLDWHEHGWFSFPGYNLLHHILAVCIAIISSVFISSYTNQILNKNDNEL